MPKTKTNTLIDRQGRELAKWEGATIPKELKKSVRQAQEMGGKVVSEWI